jgi:hypothetical protein
VIKNDVSLTQVRLAHTCNLSYSGGRDQEDDGSKPAQANSLQDPIWKISIREKKGKGVGVVAQGVGPEFKPQCHHKKKKDVF